MLTSGERRHVHSMNTAVLPSAIPVLRSHSDGQRIMPRHLPDIFSCDSESAGEELHFYGNPVNLNSGNRRVVTPAAP